MRNLILSLAFFLAAVAMAPAEAAAPATLWGVMTYSARGGALLPAVGETAVADANGDLLVAATQGDTAAACIVTLKYSGSNGAVMWRREACGPAGTHAVAIAVDGSGNAVVAGNASGTFRLLKYSGTGGAPLWEQRFGGGGMEAVQDLALDPAGDVLMMGRTVAPSSEIWIAKHRGADGAMAWQQPVDAGAEVSANGLVVDRSGNALVAGTYRNARGDEDWHLAKLAGSSGAVLWRKIHDTGGNDAAGALAVDAAGDVIVAAIASNGTARAINTVKSEGSTGRPIWEATHAVAPGDVASAVRTDGAGDVVVTGSASGHIRTLKYAAADGALRWQASYAGSGTAEFGRAIAIDGRGDVTVTGRSVAADGRVEVRTIKYAAADGAMRWTSEIAGSGRDDSGHAVIAMQGALYTVGRWTDANGAAALRVIKFAEAGAAARPEAINVQGLWWKGSEPGWGVNLTQQGDVLFATWFTYDDQGQGLWLVMSNGQRVGDDSYLGTLYRTTGPAFDSVPFDPARVAATPVGTASFSFSDASNGTFRYTVNGLSGVKAISRQVYSAPLPTCALGAAGASLPNYQDLWWAPGGSESGWGLNVTHQGDILFITWFTYGGDGRGMWLVGSSVAKTGNATYSGTLYRTSGPPFAAAGWDPARVSIAAAGHATLVFSDHDNGTFTYTLDGVSQSKPITRQLYSSPKTVCR